MCRPKGAFREWRRWSAGKRCRAPVSELQGLGARLRDLHVGEAARGAAALKQGDAEQPDVDESLGRPADMLLVIRIDVALVADPFAKIGKTAANRHVRFERGPARDRAAECGADRQARAPEISEVLAVVEL